MSHAIPRAAFKPILDKSNGNAIAIPDGDRDIHLTTDTGSAPLLCSRCESLFNTRFDAPMTNALKRLSRAYGKNGESVSITFDADHLAHAVVSVAWRINCSPAAFNSRVKLISRHSSLLDKILRSPTAEILQHCSVKLSKLSDATSSTDGGFSEDALGQIIKGPESYSVKAKPHGSLDRFAIDWSMFGFLVHVVVPRITYPKSRTFGGLKSGSNKVAATRVMLLEYKPLADGLIEGFRKNAAGKLSKGMKRRERLKS